MLINCAPLVLVEFVWLFQASYLTGFMKSRFAADDLGHLRTRFIILEKRPRNNKVIVWRKPLGELLVVSAKLLTPDST